jgi:hypothetical protein
MRLKAARLIPDALVNEMTSIGIPTLKLSGMETNASERLTSPISTVLISTVLIKLQPKRLSAVQVPVHP